MPAGRSTHRRVRCAAAVAGVAALAAIGVVALLWVTGPDPAALARENPRTTALIEQRRAEAKVKRRAFRPRQAWVPLERISPRLVDAVLLSEDANFWGHEGIDWDAMQEAARHDLAAGHFARGASTITQQLAKNLWLGTEKSLWRKAKEAVLAAKLERRLSKRRILAIYLNVVELDEGVFGMEAGARSRFGTGAATVDAAQAVVLASLLPAPRRVDLAKPSTWLKRRSRRLLDRLAAAHRITAAEHQHASAELERILAGPAPSDDRDEPPDEEPSVQPAPQAPARLEPEPVAADPADAASGPRPVPAVQREDGPASPAYRAAGGGGDAATPAAPVTPSAAAP